MQNFERRWVVAGIAAAFGLIHLAGLVTAGLGAVPNIVIAKAVPD